MQAWHVHTVPEVEKGLNTSISSGLSSEEAALRQAVHGMNELAEKRRKGVLRLFAEQFQSVMIVVLLSAAAVSAAVADLEDALVILAIVFLYVILGFVQEFRAERAIAALRRLSAPLVRVRRDGQTVEISARHLVPGDVVFFEVGNLVPADGRLVEAVNLRIQEAPLTGESVAVEKTTEPMAYDAAVADRLNMAYMGTVVTYGRGSAVVTGTGMDSELGRVAGMIQEVKRELTPLQRRLNQLGRVLAAISVAIAFLIFLLGLLRGEDLRLMFLTAVSVAVAAIPEGLPAVLTITLALGAQKMLKRQALIRKLPAVETLGSVTVICSDKTGTLTQNRMTVTFLHAAGEDYIVSPGTPQPPSPNLQHLLLIGALCNDAILREGEATVGDPTETALIDVATHYSLHPQQLRHVFPRIAELPFDSNRKRMLTLHRVESNADVGPLGIDPGANVAFVKGAVDGLLSVCHHIMIGSRVSLLVEEERERIRTLNDRLAGKGMRILGIAFRPAPIDADLKELERRLVFVGLVGMIDPPRPEAVEAVQQCRDAGIRTIMITGDHPLTASRIAADIGIADGGLTLTGIELTHLSAIELAERVGEVAVFARVAPEQKFSIVQALQAKGELVAMTGDGINDAPALKKADIGVAMGRSGTDVARESADMVLRDDNFATIVAAVEEGRVIYDNIRKFLKYSVAGNIGKILVVMLLPLVGTPLPLLPLQLLWLNLMTDGLLGLGLGMEPAEPDVMQRLPIPPGESLFARGMRHHIILLGLVIAFVSLSVGAAYWLAAKPHWQTMVFTTIAISQVFQAFAIRSDRYSLFALRPLGNPLLVGMALLVLLLQLVVIYIPVLQRYFSTIPLTPVDLATSVAASSTVLWVVELGKLKKRLEARKKLT